LKVMVDGDPQRSMSVRLEPLLVSRLNRTGFEQEAPARDMLFVKVHVRALLKCCSDWNGIT